MVCAAGLATMSEMLDREGPWTYDLLGIMVARAVQVEVAQTRRMHSAVFGAVAGFFSKQARQMFNAALERTDRAVRESLGSADTKNAEAADAMAGIADTLQLKGVVR